MLCVRSHYQLEGRFPLGIQLANKIRDSAKPVSAVSRFRERISPLRSPAEVAETGLTKLTGLEHAFGRRGRAEHLLRQSGDAVRQASGRVPAASGRSEQDRGDRLHGARDRGRTCSTKGRNSRLVPVLRNLVPAQVLAGKSSFNTGKSLSAGLPVYARSSVKAIARCRIRGEPERHIRAQGSGRCRRPRVVQMPEQQAFRLLAP